MRIGIVGSEAAKFTSETEAVAREMIQDLILQERASVVVSGGCHLGGIDAWAAEEAAKMGVDVIEHLPKVTAWEGYKARNILIAEDSDTVYCITVRELPPNYTGMRFKLCYHCGTADHVKSGGCWTTKYARSLGKPARTLVI